MILVTRGTFSSTSLMAAVSLTVNDVAVDAG